jgi:hypothetical protein
MQVPQNLNRYVSAPSTLPGQNLANSYSWPDRTAAPVSQPMMAAQYPQPDMMNYMMQQMLRYIWFLTQ